LGISAGPGARWRRRWNAVRRGWSEEDIEVLERRLNDPTAYSGGIVKLTKRQFRALEERNRRIAQSERTLRISSLLVWVEGRGLFSAVRKGVADPPFARAGCDR